MTKPTGSAHGSAQGRARTASGRRRAMGHPQVMGGDIDGASARGLGRSVDRRRQQVRGASEFPAEFPAESAATGRGAAESANSVMSPSRAGYSGFRNHPGVRTRAMSARRRARLRRSVLAATAFLVLLVTVLVMTVFRGAQVSQAGDLGAESVAVPASPVEPVPTIGTTVPSGSTAPAGGSDGSAGAAPTPAGQRPADQLSPAGRFDGATGANPQTDRVVVKGSGSFTAVAVPGADAPAPGRQVRYRVDVEGGLEAEAQAFAATVAATLRSPRGWQPADRVGFVAVSPPQASSGGPRLDLRISLASPKTVDRLCYPLRTNGEVSCYANGRVLVNQRRWVQGAPSYGSNLADYRTYLINHEVGHALGHGHLPCPAQGAKAPIMLQQTLGLNGCVAWPYPVR